MTSDLFFGTSGPPNASIVIVGEAWGSEELVERRPFIGTSGYELRKMLAEAGIDINSVLLTNVISAKPQSNEMWRYFYPNDVASEHNLSPLKGLFPRKEIIESIQKLREQIAFAKRQLVIVCGNYALWALTSHTLPKNIYTSNQRKIPSIKVPTGIMDWRGSMTYLEGSETKCLPIVHPASVLRQWELRAPTVHDLKSRVPLALQDDWRPSEPPTILAPPTFDQALTHLSSWLAIANEGKELKLVCDIETIRHTFISCIGFADSVEFAISIPFLDIGKDGVVVNYWTEKQESEIITLLYRLFRHDNIKIIGQNFIYDTQYIQTWWGVTPRLHFDTMLAHHLLFPGTPKGLDYLSSMYCKYHWFWKHDSKEWDTKGGITQLLKYNAMDCIRTFECAETLQELIIAWGMQEQWAERLEINSLALRMMNRGIKIDQKRKHEISVNLLNKQAELCGWLESIIPQSMVNPDPKVAKWYNSPSQQKMLFGEIFGMKIPSSRKTGNATLGKEGLPDLSNKYPAFSRIFATMGALRSVGVFYSHFIKPAIERNGRMVCSFNVAGTETFRWSSSSNAFGRGTNLQNIPSGDE